MVRISHFVCDWNTNKISSVCIEMSQTNVWFAMRTIAPVRVAPVIKKTETVRPEPKPRKKLVPIHSDVANDRQDDWDSFMN